MIGRAEFLHAEAALRKYRPAIQEIEQHRTVSPRYRTRAWIVMRAPLDDGWVLAVYRHRYKSLVWIRDFGSVEKFWRHGMELELRGDRLVSDIWIALTNTYGTDNTLHNLMQLLILNVDMREEFLNSFRCVIADEMFNHAMLAEASRLRLTRESRPTLLMRGQCSRHFGDLPEVQPIVTQIQPQWSPVVTHPSRNTRWDIATYRYSDRIVFVRRRLGDAPTRFIVEDDQGNEFYKGDILPHYTDVLHMVEQQFDNVRGYDLASIPLES